MGVEGFETEAKFSNLVRKANGNFCVEEFGQTLVKKQIGTSVWK